ELAAEARTPLHDRPEYVKQQRLDWRVGPGLASGVHEPCQGGQTTAHAAGDRRAPQPVSPIHRNFSWQLGTSLGSKVGTPRNYLFARLSTPQSLSIKSCIFGSYCFSSARTKG